MQACAYVLLAFALTEFRTPWTQSWAPLLETRMTRKNQGEGDKDSARRGDQDSRDAAVMRDKARKGGKPF